MTASHQISNKCDSLIRVFLYILIFWLPYSPAVVEVCTIISLIIWLTKRSLVLLNTKNDNASPGPWRRFLNAYKPESTFLNKPIGFFLLACVLSVSASAFIEQSFHNFLTKTVEWFVIYFLVVEVFKEKKHFGIALGIFVFTAFSTALDGLLQYYITHKDIFLGHVITPGDRATAGFKTANGLGAYLSLAVTALAAWVMLSKQKNLYRAGFALVLIIMIWTLFVTFSRGAWTGTFIGSMFLVCFIFLVRQRVDYYLSLGIVGIAVIFCISFVLFLVNSLGQESLNRYHTIPWRLQLWTVAFEMIKDKPFLGHGINTFMRIFQAYRGEMFSGPTYAHNCLIQLTAETGMAGLLCFIWIFVRLFHQTLGRIRNFFESERNMSVLAVGLLSGIFAYMIHSFFDTILYSLQLSVYLWLMTGFLVAVCKRADALTLQK